MKFTECSSETATITILDRIFRQSPSWMTVLSLPDHRFTSANEAYHHLIGRRDIIGKTVAEVFSATTAHEFNRLLDDVNRTHQSVVGTEMPFRVESTDDGSPRCVYADFVCELITRSDGSPQSVVAIGGDVTERVRTREKLSARSLWLESILERLGTGVVLFDPKTWEPFFMNQAARRMTNGTMEKPGEGPLNYQVLDADRVPLPRDKWPRARAARGESIIGEKFSWASPMGCRDFLVYAGLMPPGYGRGEAAMISLIDITELARAESRVAASERKLDQIFNAAPSTLTLLVGPDFIYERANRQFFDITGYPKSILGKPAREVHQGVDVSGFLEILDRAYRTGERFEGKALPFTAKRPDGSTRLYYLDCSYQPIPGTGCDVEAIVCQTVDVTDQVKARKDLNESHKKYRLLFEKSPLPKWVIETATSRFVDVNRAAIDHYGYSREEFLRMTAKDIRPPEDIPDFLEMMERPHESGAPPERHLFRHRKKDGTVIHVEVLGLDLTIDGRDCRIATMVDVTERLLNQSRQEELVRTLKAAKEEAVRANKLKSSFLANMSHEIRTPLGAILGFTDLMRDPNLSPEDRETYLDIVTRNGEQLAQIIDDILDLSKVEAGHLTFEFKSADPERIARDVTSLLSLKAREKGLTLDFRAEVSTPRSFVTDGLRLHQILLNIVGNAVKFTAAGSVKVRSFATTAENGDATLYFEVTDTGIGITEKAKDKLFHAFVQADGTLVREFGGSGLGLALSRQLARGLGGDLELTKSASGAGSTFLISIREPFSPALSPGARSTTDINLWRSDPAR